MAQEKLGNIAKSHQFFQEAIASRSGSLSPEMEYYQGLAAMKLGQSAKGQQLFDSLLARGEKMLDGSSESGFFAKFGRGRSERYRKANAHYLIGLGNLGKGATEEARKEFEQALKMEINHLGARAQLTAMSGTNTRASR